MSVALVEVENSILCNGWSAEHCMIESDIPVS